jgi:hypothetical protein
MRFNIFLANHGAAAQDLALHLQHSLQSCGHTAYFSFKLVRGICNIVIENFGPKLVDLMLELADADTPLVFWGTEEITGETFNLKVEETNTHYANKEYWKLRYDNFAAIAREATAIWVPIESLVEPYSALAPGVPVQFFPHGYTDGYPRVPKRPEAERNIDFLFTGSSTEHRRNVLARLSERHSTLSHHHEVPDFIRRDFLSRAKVCLSLKLGPHTRLPSVSRIHNLLMNQCFVLQEDCPVPSHLDAFVHRAPTAELHAACERELAASDRHLKAEDMYERFRAALPMKEIVPKLLEEVFPAR